MWAVIAFSFYLRKSIGRKTWRLIHFVSFLSYMMALLHGITSGTDSAAPGMVLWYWFSGGSLLFLVVYRIMVSLFIGKTQHPVAVNIDVRDT